MKHSNGFSLIELLASTVILGVLITVVLAPLGQLFQSTNRSGQTLRGTTQAQEVVERIRGQWQSYPVVMVTDASGSTSDQNIDERTVSQSQYDSTCGTLPVADNVASYRITVRALDRSATETRLLVDNATSLPACGSAVDAAPMKRITVTSTTANGDQSSLTLDIPRP